MSGQAGRYQRSAGGMVGAMLVLGGADRRLGRLPGADHPGPRPARCRRGLRAGRAAGPRSAPPTSTWSPRPSLPEGLAGHHRCASPPAPRRAWHLGVLTDEDRYVGLEQSRPARCARWSRSTSTRTPSAGGPPTSRAGLGDVHRRRAATSRWCAAPAPPPRWWSGHEVPQVELVSYAASLR